MYFQLQMLINGNIHLSNNLVSKDSEIKCFNVTTKKWQQNIIKLKCFDARGKKLFSLPFQYLRVFKNQTQVSIFFLLSTFDKFIKSRISDIKIIRVFFTSNNITYKFVCLSLIFKSTSQFLNIFIIHLLQKSDFDTLG